MSKNVKKKTARSDIKYPGLNTNYNSRAKREYLDQDYIEQLNDYEKQFLSDFNEEYYGAVLDFKDLSNNRFHKTKKLKKQCTDRNNARNRCTMSIARSQNKLLEFKEVMFDGKDDPEDHL